MIDRLLFAMTLFSALGTRLMAGLFFAFSSFVMAALGRLPPAGGIAAMQSINVAVLNPLFFAAFLGPAVACVLLAAAPPPPRSAPRVLPASAAKVTMTVMNGFCDGCQASL